MRQQLSFLLYEFHQRRGAGLLAAARAATDAAFLTVALYRVKRGAFLSLGPAWPIAQALLAPVGLLLRPWLPVSEIHYRADLGPGLSVTHPALGVVVSPAARAGCHLTLTGGNCLGVRRTRGAMESGALCLGDRVFLGANAVVLGPCRVGSGATIGAGAVVVRDVPDGATVAGVPARPLAPSQASVCLSPGAS